MAIRQIYPKMYKLFREFATRFPEYADKAQSFGLIGTDGKGLVISFDRQVPHESVDDIQPGEIWFHYTAPMKWESRMYTTESFFDWEEVLR